MTSSTPGNPAPPHGQFRLQRLFIRRTSWWILLGFALILTVASATLRTATIPPRGEAIPANAESARVAAELKSRPGSDIGTALLVTTRTDQAPLTPQDRHDIAQLTADVTPTDLQGKNAPAAGPPRPVISEDGHAAITTVPLRIGTSNAETATTISELRDRIDHHRPTALHIDVTGGPAFGADIAGAFAGADFTLLTVTIVVVAVLLLLTYRSPTLWLVPLTVVALADQLAATVTKGAGQASGLTFDAGIVSVLVFGAGTNYAMLLISRYREELHIHPDHRDALATAWRAVLPAILASNLTVVLALSSLLAAIVPGTRGLGLAGAVGLLIAAAAALLPLPAALLLLGRRVFWPFVPHPTDPTDPAAHTQYDTAWHRLGTAVTARPVAVVLIALTTLGILATGLIGTRIGLTQSEQFRVASDSQRGLDTAAAHFPAGTIAPITVLTDTDHLDTVTADLRDIPHLTSVRPGATVDGRTALTVTGDAIPGSNTAHDLVTTIRDRLATHPETHSLVGGAPAVQVDARSAAQRDLTVIAPIILTLTALILMVLLRAVLIPLVLLAVNALSSLATIGAGAWIGRTFLGFPALDVQVPLIAFLFLVALGVDYTIFLVHRAHQEMPLHGTRAGMARAVGATGAVITSAGIVLAAVFAALGVLPLVVLGQLGLIVGLGVIIDTFVVRTLLVPGLVTVLRRAPAPPTPPGATRVA
ncbi:MMPL family transporter [Austwickia sp. TVS 96-490-7B]|uniref:MMPL family transporter n=1 Tax=Austwickia sp. TVS 96-490-7B TaxID=2830843 RepID=UPI001C5768CA|nr:MMPL family transporter [Austwickia sp. TVS 96-490-7B]